MFDYWSPTSRTLATISLAAQGVTSERVFIPQTLVGGPPALGEIPIDSNLAWALAVKAGMPNQIVADVDLFQQGADRFWRIAWTSGGQAYRVNAVSGEAGLETSPSASPSP